jgi:hypothetical protein
MQGWRVVNRIVCETIGADKRILDGQHNAIRCAGDHGGDRVLVVRERYRNAWRAEEHLHSILRIRPQLALKGHTEPFLSRHAVKMER